ncbi:hypothetical protein [Spiroplasma endosymbiont of Panzeria rudis]|uniref:hypothetical protein n=1 Tax=Spiroplasma endosymbiont of Panzeria rudis TaxID=3066301 RepID=UPI0030D187BD
MIKINLETWKGLIRNWIEVNPNRDGQSVTNKVKQHANYLFQPYYDGGLWIGTTPRDLINGKEIILHDGKKVFNKIKDLKSITLAFVQQAIAIKDKLELTIAGQSLGAGYDYWVENKLKPEVLKPLVKNDGFNNIVVAYGGAASTVGYNPWDVAYTLSNKDINKAVAMLQPALIEYQERITKFAGFETKDMPLNLDLDIEGINFDSDHINEMKVLFTTLTKMKRNNQNWNFSVTLPVMPTGLVGRDIENVIKIALEIYQKADLKVEDLFTINIMAMDYGEIVGQEVIDKGLTFFDIAKQAIKSTANQYFELIKQYFPKSNLLLTDVYQKLGITPMIGINDVNNNYFTLEDAKDLYNWAQTNKLANIRIWLLNRDSNGKIDEVWGTNNHGLKYLNEGDFTNVFTGNWTYWVKSPVRKV